MNTIKKPHIRLFFRRANPTGNVSIESSFQSMLAHFPQENNLKIDTFTSSFYSVGLLARLKAIWEVCQHRADVNHITGDTNFLALGLPSKTTILTIHDCGLLDGKGRLARWILQTFWLKLPARHARFVTVVSEATKRDVLRYTRCSAEKIVVIPTVIKPNFRYKPKEFNKIKPVFLHIGNSPNKNLERHAAALQGLNCQLHIVGKISDQQIRLLNDLKIDHVISINLSHNEMRKAYENADVLLFCSLIEGFGMPILEAQSVGRVVITSTVSAMPEVAGNSALLVDPLSIKDIRAAIDRVLADDNYRNTLIEKGLQNIKRFNPATVAQQYAALYEKILKL